MYGIQVTEHIRKERIQDFKLGGGAHLKKLRRAEGGAKIVGVFRVKFYANKLYFFQFPPGSAPVRCSCCKRDKTDVSPTAVTMSFQEIRNTVMSRRTVTLSSI